jgi:hypothetical protein
MPDGSTMSRTNFEFLGSLAWLAHNKNKEIAILRP